MDRTKGNVGEQQFSKEKPGLRLPVYLGRVYREYFKIQFLLDEFINYRNLLKNEYI